MTDYFIYNVETGAILTAGNCLEADVPKAEPGFIVVTGKAAGPLTHHVVDGKVKKFTKAQRARRQQLRPGHRWAGAAQGWVDALAPETRAQVDRHVSVADQLSAIWAELLAQPGGLKSQAARAMAQKLGAK